MLKQVYTFLSLIIFYIVILEYFFPTLVLVFLNPLFIISFWFLLGLYLLIKKNENI